MYLSIYGMSFLKTIFFLAAFSCLWYAGKRLAQKYAPQIHSWRWLAVSGLVLWAYCVLKYTLFSRETSAQTAIWMPFQQLWRFRQSGDTEILRMLWMNILLFVPLGIFLPELFPAQRRTRSKVVLTVGFAMLLSLGIELAQWHWQLGQAETDDVIANTLGALLGCGIFVLGNRIISRKKAHNVFDK